MLVFPFFFTFFSSVYYNHCLFGIANENIGTIAHYVKINVCCKMWTSHGSCCNEWCTIFFLFLKRNTLEQLTFTLFDTKTHKKNKYFKTPLVRPIQPNFISLCTKFKNHRYTFHVLQNASGILKILFLCKFWCWICRLLNIVNVIQVKWKL